MRSSIIGADRAAMLDKIRRDQHRERAALTPTERLARADELRALGRDLHGPRSARGDEPLDLLLRVRAAFRKRSTP